MMEFVSKSDFQMWVSRSIIVATGPFGPAAQSSTFEQFKKQLAIAKHLLNACATSRAYESVMSDVSVCSQG